jgi:hypothetical protein
MRANVSIRFQDLLNSLHFYFVTYHTLYKRKEEERKKEISTKGTSLLDSYRSWS